MHKLWIFSLLVLVACRKEDFMQGTIVDLSKNYPTELKRLSQLRLALAKTVAVATCDVRFRDYIKITSKQNTTEYFNEILLELHKEDIVYDNKTLLQILRENTPRDVDAMFGDSLFYFLHTEDPCVVIKIPDIFYYYDWDTHEISPMVFAGIPSCYLNGGYYAFHHSGYQQEIIDNGVPEFFYLTVKLSEDYSLYDINTWDNEKGISLFEMIPQLQYDDCWDKTEIEIYNTGIAYDKNPSRRYINKYQAFQIWKKSCSYRGPLLMNNPCGKTYLRDCVPHGESKLILKEVLFPNEVLFSLINNQFGDGFSYFIKFWENPENRTIGIPSLRYRTLGGDRFTIQEKFETIRYEDIGKVKLPKMLIEDIAAYISKPFEVNAEMISKFVNPYEQYYAAIATYEDIINNHRFPEPKPVRFNATNLAELGEGELSYKDNPPVRTFTGDALDNYFIY